MPPRTGVPDDARQPDPTRRPLLVTGMARAGTSWVGKMLEAGGDFVYINEPMNPRHPPGRSPGILNADITQEYLYITGDNGPSYVDAFRDTVRFRYHVLAEVRQNHRPFDLAKMAKYFTSFALGRLLEKRPMLNDPYATLSARWLAEELGAQVVSVVRQPAAMLASFRKLGYERIDFRALLDQPLLMRDWLEPLRAEMETAEGEDLVAQVALLWRILYRVTAAYRSIVPGFVVVRHEDLSLDPVAAYEKLHADLGLPFTTEVRAAVEEGSGLTTPTSVGGAGAEADAEARTGSETDAGGKTGSEIDTGANTVSKADAGAKTHIWRLSRRNFLSRTAYRPMDSRASLGAWHSTVTPDEIARIRWLTEDVARLYYTDAELDWLLAGSPNDGPSPFGDLSSVA